MSNSKRKNQELILHGNLFNAVLALAIPVVINSLLQAMYNITDTYWLGKIGTNELAAINLITPLQNTIISFGTGITVAGSVLIAQYIGAGKREDAKSMANQIFLCAMAFALVCSAVCFLATPAILTWMGADGDTFQLSKTYMQIVIWDMIFLYMVNIFSAIHQAQGDTVKPMLLNLAGILLNMVLDPLLMITLDMGIAGAAWATLLAKVIPAVIAFCMLIRGKKEIALDTKYMRFQADKVQLILRIGLPTAIGGSTMQLGFLIMSKNVYVYGNQAMAAYGIGNKVNGIISMTSDAIGSAVATIVGQNIGARQLKRAEKGYWISMVLSVVILISGGMLFSRDAVATAIVSIFSDDPEVIAMAADFLSIMAFWCFLNGIYNSTRGLFQGAGHTEVSMIIDITRLWVFRFATIWVCENILHMGVRSIWYSVVVSNGISTTIFFLLYLSKVWKKPKIMAGDRN